MRPFSISVAASFDLTVGVDRQDEVVALSSRRFPPVKNLIPLESVSSPEKYSDVTTASLFPLGF